MTRTRRAIFVLTASLLFGGVAAPAFATALSDTLQRYQSLCAQNAQCSAEVTERGLLFRLRMQNRTQQMLCQSDGLCEALLPRSVRYRVEDAPAWFLVK